MSDTALIILYIFSIIMAFNSGFFHGTEYASKYLPARDLRILKNNRELKEKLKNIQEGNK